MIGVKELIGEHVLVRTSVMDSAIVETPDGQDIVSAALKYVGQLVAESEHDITLMDNNLPIKVHKLFIVGVEVEDFTSEPASDTLN